MYQLTNDDYDKIKQLKGITDKIANCYGKLEQLEKDGPKNTLEYQYALTILKKLIDEEDKIYAEITSYDKGKAWFLYLSKSLNQENVRNPIYRIIQTIQNRILVFPESLQDMHISLMEVNDLIFSGVIRSEEELKSFIWNEEFFNKIFYKEMTLVALLFMNEFFNDASFKQFREKIISIKHTFAFLSKNIEEALLINNFDIPMVANLSSRFLAAHRGVKEVWYTLYKDSYAVRSAKTYLKIFESESDETYKSDDDIKERLIQLCFLKSAFYLMSKTGRELFEEYFNEVFLDKKNIDITKGLILEALKEIKSDFGRN